MSIHSSFRSAATGSGHRNVLTRLERLEKLEGAGAWKTDEAGMLGLPKVRSIKIAMKKKKRKEEAAEGDGK